tara:strand:- start:1742 stop:2428 length:687 start_codon:yes stop_codon:yes gene_type:complete
MSSELKITNLKHASSSSNNLVLASDGSATIANATLSAGSLGSSVTGNWGWKLLETQTVSGDINNLTVGSASTITSTYSVYKIIMEDFTIQTSTSLLGKFLISGTAKTTGYDYNSYGYDSDDNRLGQSSNSQSYFSVTNISFSPAATEVQGINGEFTLTNPSANHWHGIRYTIDFNNSNNRATRGTGTAGHRRHRDATNKGPLTGINFFTNSGTAITRGTLRLYGVINA